MTPPAAPAVSETAIGELVRRFYDKARRDPVIGPVFEDAVEDWDAHFDRLTDFWCSVMLGAASYKGNPFGVHRPLPMAPEMFDTWLGLWRETTAELFEPAVAAAFDEKAERIAASLAGGLFFRPGA